MLNQFKNIPTKNCIQVNLVGYDDTLAVVGHLVVEGGRRVPAVAGRAVHKAIYLQVSQWGGGGLWDKKRVTKEYHTSTRLPHT